MYSNSHTMHFETLPSHKPLHHGDGQPDMNALFFYSMNVKPKRQCAKPSNMSKVTWAFVA